jgi:hypothetical protein
MGTSFIRPEWDLTPSSTAIAQAAMRKSLAARMHEANS